MSKPGDEPAYPLDMQRDESGQWTESLCRGLTKRELFAAMAMQGICADPEAHKDEQTAPGIAIGAVKCADALLAELAKEAAQ